jgi:hypothetical protein
MDQKQLLALVEQQYDASMVKLPNSRAFAEKRMRMHFADTQGHITFNPLTLRAVHM